MSTKVSNEATLGRDTGPLSVSKDASEHRRDAHRAGAVNPFESMDDEVKASFTAKAVDAGHSSTGIWQHGQTVRGVEKVKVITVEVTPEQKVKDVLSDKSLTPQQKVEALEKIQKQHGLYSENGYDMRRLIGNYYNEQKKNIIKDIESGKTGQERAAIAKRYQDELKTIEGKFQHPTGIWFEKFEEVKEYREALNSKSEQVSKQAATEEKQAKDAADKAAATERANAEKAKAQKHQENIEAAKARVKEILGSNMTEDEKVYAIRAVGDGEDPVLKNSGKAMNMSDKELVEKVIHPAVDDAHRDLAGKRDKHKLESLKNVVDKLDHSITNTGDGLQGKENSIYKTINNIKAEDEKASRDAEKKQKADAAKAAAEAKAAQELAKAQEAERSRLQKAADRASAGIMVKNALTSGKSESEMIADLKKAADKAGYKPGSKEMEQLLNDVIDNLSARDVAHLDTKTLRILEEKFCKDNAAFEKTFDDGGRFTPRHKFEDFLEDEIARRKKAA